MAIDLSTQLAKMFALQELVKALQSSLIDRKIPNLKKINLQYHSLSFLVKSFPPAVSISFVNGRPGMN